MYGVLEESNPLTVSYWPLSLKAAYCGEHREELVEGFGRHLGDYVPLAEESVAYLLA